MRRLVIVSTLAAASSLFGTSGAASEDPAGRALVDKLVVLFEQVAQSPVPVKIEATLDEVMASAKKARAEKRIEAGFFERYTRVVRVFKLVTLDDKEGILRPIAEREFASFVKDVENVDAPQPVPLGTLARAITHELESLKN